MSAALISGKERREHEERAKGLAISQSPVASMVLSKLIFKLKKI